MTYMMAVFLEDLLVKLRNIPRSGRTLLVGIDGCGGSGKSTLAKQLEALGEDVTVVHMDDFYLSSVQRATVDPAEIGGSFDWRRVRQQVLVPLSQDVPGWYQRYDWESDRLAEWHDVPTGGTVILEGVYSLRKELAGFYTFRIWVESPRTLRLARGIARDGEEARPLWEQEWMPAEDRYVQAHRPDSIANMVIDGTGVQSDSSPSWRDTR